LGKKILKSDVSIYLAVGAAITTLILNNTYVFPILILVGGIVSSALESSADETQLRTTLFSNINTRKVLYFVGVLLFLRPWAH
jgi:chromate transporter